MIGDLYVNYIVQCTCIIYSAVKKFLLQPDFVYFNIFVTFKYFRSFN